jgi:UDP-GlcNAc:undecaprenyl-phosphate GlcNAc-1-phosphate transferase
MSIEFQDMSDRIRHWLPLEQFNYRTYFGCFVLGVLVSVLLTPWIIRLACRWRIMDQPASRKMHQRPTPLLGGLAVFWGMWIPLALLMTYHNDITRAIFADWKPLVLILVGGFSMLLLGIYDDIRGLTAKWKLIVQLPIALGLWVCGVRFELITLPYLGSIELGLLGPVLSLLWLVGVTNALNLIDGIDGLAAGVAFFVSATNAVIAIINGNPLLALIMCSMAGACLGFLRYNFSPAKVFLGDTGSLFLGMTLAVSSVVTNYKGTVASSMLIPVLVLGYPVVDTLLSMLRRVARGKSMFTGDAGHIHHRLLAKGLGHRKASVVLYGMCCLFSLVALAMVMEKNMGTAVGLLLLTIILLFGLWFLGYLRFFSAVAISQERKQYQIAFHFSEMVKAKIGLAVDAEEVFRQIQETVTEFGIPRVELELEVPNSGQAITRCWVPGHPDGNHSIQWDNTQLRRDSYEFAAHGMKVEVLFPVDFQQNELLLEKRSLFEDIVRAAGDRMTEIATWRDKQNQEST